MISCRYDVVSISEDADRALSLDYNDASLAPVLQYWLSDDASFQT